MFTNVSGNDISKSTLLPLGIPLTRQAHALHAHCDHQIERKNTAEKDKAALNTAALNVNESGDLIWVEEPEQVEPQLRKGLKTGLYSKT